MLVSWLQHRVRAYEQRENVDLFICLTDPRPQRRLNRPTPRKIKPKQPILACSTSGQTVRQCNLSRGVVGYNPILAAIPK